MFYDLYFWNFLKSRDYFIHKITDKSGNQKQHKGKLSMKDSGLSNEGSHYAKIESRYKKIKYTREIYVQVKSMQGIPNDYDVAHHWSQVPHFIVSDIPRYK